MWVEVATDFDCSVLPGWSYKEICKELLPVLNLEVNGRDHTANRGWLLPGLDLWWLSPKTSVPQGLRLSAHCL